MFSTSKAQLTNGLKVRQFRLTLQQVNLEAQSKITTIENLDFIQTSPLTEPCMMQVESTQPIQQPPLSIFTTLN